MLRNYRALPDEEVLDVLIIRRVASRSEDPFLIWEYRLWTPEQRQYAELCSSNDLSLYPGEHAQVAGKSVYPTALSNSLVVDEVRDSDFVIKEGNIVRLLSPEKSTRPNTTYAPWVLGAVNGRTERLHVQAFARGKVVEDRSLKPSVRVNGIVRSRNNNGYILLATFD